MDVENPLYGSSACGVYWSAYSLTSGSEEPIEILIHNPHRFGNETAIDEFLSNTALWAGFDFEKGVLLCEECAYDGATRILTLTAEALQCVISGDACDDEKLKYLLT